MASASQGDVLVDMDFINFYLRRRMSTAAMCVHFMVYVTYLIILTVLAMQYVTVSFDGWETGEHIRRMLDDGYLNMGPEPKSLYASVTWKDLAETWEFWEWMRCTPSVHCSILLSTSVLQTGGQST